jgi:hypothetical protein
VADRTEQMHALADQAWERIAGEALDDLVVGVVALLRFAGATHPADDARSFQLRLVERLVKAGRARAEAAEARVAQLERQLEEAEQNEQAAASWRNAQEGQDD